MSESAIQAGRSRAVDRVATIMLAGLFPGCWRPTSPSRTPPSLSDGRCRRYCRPASGWRCSRPRSWQRSPHSPAIPAVVAQTQELPLATLAVVAASIPAMMPARSSETAAFTTLLCTLGLALATGLFFFLLSYFRLGRATNRLVQVLLD